MITEYVGAKLDFGYNNISSHDGSIPFESDYFRTDLQAVVNVGNVLNFRNWTDRFNVLIHGGMGYSWNTPKEPIEFSSGDEMVNVMFGITPQLRLSDRIALTGDFTIIAHDHHDVTWDGVSSVSAVQSDADQRGLNGHMFNASIGLTFYLGKNAVHADWYSEEVGLRSELEELEERVAKIETDMIDSDQDGVPDYLDREPNTVSGVAVDSKGRAVDLNNNGIPDELEMALDQRYTQQAELERAVARSQSGMIRDLIDKGYVNVYFRFNSDQPETYSLEAINYLIKYMNENPSANADLIGYADEIGNPEYNQRLSERRANRVKEILVASGVDAGRLTVKAGGEDASVEKGSAPARQLVRRVTFKLK
jgi:OOP family OmpA-OmpF porin